VSHDREQRSRQSGGGGGQGTWGGGAPGKGTLVQQLQLHPSPGAVQARGDGASGAAGAGGPAGASVQEVAAEGLSGSPTSLPHGDAIQRSFGRHDVSSVQAHVGGPAAAASEQMGAQAYATGSSVAFKSSPDMFTAAHEAAHVVQQRAGVSLKGGVGEVGDQYEQHADAVAETVVQGKSAEGLLDQMAPGGGAATAAVQPRVVQLDATTDARRANHFADPTMLPADQANANVHNRRWGHRGTLFVNGIRPEDVHQTNINDCYLVAVLASIASSQPEYIRQIIREDAPGRYAVRFFEKDTATNQYRQIWIAVDSWLPTEDRADGSQQIRYGHSNDTNADGDRELWPSIIEKAYAKLKGNYPDIDWGNTVYSYEALFGSEGGRQNTNGGATAGDQTAVWNQVKQSIDNRQALVCSTGQHVVTPLSYVEAPEKKIRVRDQAATNDGAATGITEYTLASFCTTFTYIRFASPNEVANSSSGINLAGRWDTDFGTVEITSVDHDKFTGTYTGGAAGGTFPHLYQGGDSMFGRWQSNTGASGGLRFAVAEDRRSFTGTWGHGLSNEGGGTWNGRRQS
jgi:hypothetical protein